MENELKDSILKSISLQGSALPENAEKHLVLGSRANLNHVLRTSSGSPRIREPKKFQLILSLPKILSALNAHEVKCVLCGKTIHYPAWYYNIKYVVNHFHYFVCFDGDSPESVTAKCFRRN